MCGADVDMSSRQQMNELCWAGMLLLQYGGGHSGSFGIYGELQSLLQTSAPPLSAVSKVQGSVRAPEADFTGLVKACVCKYTCIHTPHICTGMRRGSSSRLAHLAGVDQISHERQSSKGEQSPVSFLTWD